MRNTINHRQPSLPLAAPPLPERWSRLRKHAKNIIELTLNRAPKAIEPFLEGGEAWRLAASEEIAALAAGTLGPIGMAALTSAAYQLAWSRYLMVTELGKREGDADLKRIEFASRLADAARLNSHAAYELAIRIARATAEGQSGDPLAHIELPEDVKHADPPDGF